MESTKLSALLVLAMLALSSSPLALARVEPECHSCESGSPPSTGIPLPPISIPSVPLPSVPLPSVPLPSVPLPPVSIPSVPLPSVPLPSVPLPPVSIPSVPLPSVPLPPVSLPPIPIIGGTPTKKGHRKACPPPPSPPTPTPTPSSDTCPIDALKLGACVDVLGNEVQIGDANVKCCPLVKGIAGLSAAACLCTAIKAKVLDISIYVPIALEVLLNCGCAVPPGYKCA